MQVPSINWELTSSKVLTMEYCEGGQVNDPQYMARNGIKPQQVRIEHYKEARPFSVQNIEAKPKPIFKKKKTIFSKTQTNIFNLFRLSFFLFFRDKLCSAGLGAPWPAL